MPSTQDILDAAKKLGNLISEHDVAKKVESAAKRLDDDRDAQRALTDYNRHLQALSEKEQKGQPIEVEDKHKLQSLQNAVIRNPLLREFQTAQMDYVDLLRKVDEAMTGEAPGPAAAAAPGSPIVQ